jgi:Secretion system C-terminal sorting domain/Fibronectin type III domain
MKKIAFILIVSTLYCFTAFAQLAGDYRSIANGNWNNAANWEIYNGSSWVNTDTYPGQNAGTGSVTIIHETEIKITASIPHPVANLSVNGDYGGFIITDCEYPVILPSGVLTFSAVHAASLDVSGDVYITGRLKIDNQDGAKTHTLVIGHNLTVGIEVYDTNCYGYVYLGDLQTADVDDKLGITFTTTDPNSSIYCPNGLLLQDVTFDCVRLNGSMQVAGSATFINGIVHGGVLFLDGATTSGGSAVSHVNGGVVKIGDDTFTFPIGDENVYAPVTISGLPRQERFSVAYYRNSGANLGTISDPGLSSVSECEYWYIGRDGSSTLEYPLDISIGWTTASRCGLSSYITDAASVTLAHNLNSLWNSHGGTGTGSAANGSVTWNDFTTLGILTLGNVSTSCKTPSGLTALNITTSSATVSWTEVPGAVNYAVDYRPGNSGYSWTNAATASLSTSANLTGLNPASIYEWKVRANCSSASSSNKLAQFTTQTVCNDVYETNNVSGQAKTIVPGNTIFAGIFSPTDVDWYKLTPNNSKITFVVTLSNLAADYDLYVYDKTLRLVGSSQTTGISNEVVSIVSNSPKNTYYIKVVGKNGAYTTQCYNLMAQSQAEMAASSRAPGSDIAITDGSNSQLLYPNPASQFVYLGLSSEIEVTTNVQIINAVGQVKKLYAVKLRKGFNQLKIPVNDLTPGTYLLRINKAELNVIRKVIIKR